MLTANEYQSSANGGGVVRILPRDESSRGIHLRNGSSPSPAPLVSSPPPVAHPLDGPSSALNYQAQNPIPRIAPVKSADSHELEF